jgi:NTP pyrophosphatase (non-canonical NTP hydrolase)
VRHEAAPNQASRFCLLDGGQIDRGQKILDDNRLTIDELTEKMHEFVRSKGWYTTNSKRPQTPRNLSISLALEAAEILEHFQWNEDFNKDELAGELADVALYLLQLASISEIDLEQAILKKLEINATREWNSEFDDLSSP